VKKDKISFHMESDIQQHIAIGSLALGLNLTQDNIEKFIIYLKMINSYQNRINITSITKPYDIISKHFLDSLSSLKLINQELLNYDQGKRIKIIDVGSGAGFPGLPLKIVLPKVSMVLLEARGNRVMFLNDVVDSLELKDTKIIKDRAENIGKMAEYRENFHIVLSRAVAPLAVLCEYCLPLCKVKGAMIAFKGSSYYQELSSNNKVIEKLGGLLESVNMIKIPYSNHVRYIIVIRKISSTPENYPRKNGIPQKRPLYFE
jgi:16S rRNA (guanine527-N7)-methyltransferase